VFVDEKAHPVNAPRASRERRVRLPKAAKDDRRSSPRYPLALDLRYTIQRGVPSPKQGNGRTVDMSSSGLRFRVDRDLTPGTKVELAISWPLLLDGGVELQLVASGKVVWCKGNEGAVQIRHHEFRTRGVGLKLA
jgi:hypothetical protein